MIDPIIRAGGLRRRDHRQGVDDVLLLRSSRAAGSS